MISTLRWTVSVLILSLLLVQIVTACPGLSGEYGRIGKRAPSSHSNREVKASRGGGRPRRELNFPDTNANRGINRGNRPYNKKCKKWYGIRDVILRDVFGGEFVSVPPSMQLLIRSVVRRL